MVQLLYYIDKSIKEGNTKMKKVISIIMPLIMLFTAIGCEKADNNSSEDDTTSKTNITAAERSFSIDGTKLIDANGNEFVMRGVNHAHTWFKDDTVVALMAIQQTGSNTVRIVLSDGQQWDKDDIESVKSLIEQCKSKKMIPVLEVHDATGKDDIESLEKAVDYWVEIKDALIGQEEFVILNIANEWIGQWESETWRDGYVSAVRKLREAGIKNTIMVDSAGWGQYPRSVAEHGKEVLEADPLKNTMFSVHFYGSAGGNERKIKNALNNARNEGLCICVGEFGYTHTDGDVDEDFIMQYCTEENIGYLGWSWKGNSGGVEYLDIAEEWNGSKLSADWGEKLINGEYGIKKTAKVCSVFES